MNETSTDYVGVSDVARLLQEDKGATLVDARTAEEFEVGHASGAVNVPIANLNEFVKSRDAGSAGLVITMCGSSGRGEKAAAILASHDMAKVVVLRGGLKAWRDAGLPVV
jgi:rhodanese-related sulfurtransferase